MNYQRESRKPTVIFVVWAAVVLAILMYGVLNSLGKRVEVEPPAGNWRNELVIRVVPAGPEAAIGPGDATVTALPTPVVLLQPTPVVVNIPEPESAVAPVAMTAVPVLPTAVPAAEAGLLRIEVGGRVFELTPVQLVDCINAQQNGRRSGPKCPANAQQYAGLLGSGR